MGNDDIVRFKYDRLTDSLLDEYGKIVVAGFSATGLVPLDEKDSSKRFKQVKELIDAGVKPSEIIEMKEAGVI